MTSDSGDRGRDFPELPPGPHKAILDTFNVDNPFFPGYLGIRVVDVRRGYARLEVENRQPLSNPAGVMHGGASFGLADTAVAVALISIYGPGNALLTIEMKINYLSRSSPGRSPPKRSCCAPAGAAPTPRSTCGRAASSQHAPAPLT